MRAILIIIVCSTVVGLGFGAALAVMQIPSAEPLPKQTVSPQANLPVVKVDENAPQAEVPETIFEFGSIELGASRSHLFKVYNKGGSPLKIEVVKTTCKCTVGSLSDDEIQPGEFTEVRLEWVAKPSPGPFRHSATLKTNDPAQSQIELTVEGKIVASTLLLNPTDLVFGTMQAGESKEASLQLLSYIDEYFKVLDYEFSSEELRQRIDVRIEPIEKEDLIVRDAVSGFKILTTCRAGSTLGMIRGTLTLTTNLKEAETFVIPVRAHVIGDIAVYGAGWYAKEELLRIGRVSSAAGKKVRLNLSVRGNHAKATEFTVARVDPSELKVRLGEARVMSEKLLHVPLMIEIPAGTKSIVRMGEPASTDAIIILSTTHPETPEVQLRVHFAVEE